LFQAFASFARADDDRPLVPSITVVGTGEASARPDMAHLQIGVVTQSASAGEALRSNNDAMDRLLKALAARDIAEKGGQTSNFSVPRQYRRGPHGQMEPEIVGYQVSNQVHVKVRQLATLGAVLDEVVRKGANQVQGITFSVAEPQPIL